MTHQKIRWTSIEKAIVGKLVKKYGPDKGVAIYYAMRKDKRLKTHGNGMARATKAPSVDLSLTRRIERLKKVPFESNDLKDVINKEVKKLGGGEK